MQSRRSFLVGTSSAAMFIPLSGCASDATRDYERAQSQLRSRLSANPGLLDLIRLATLAPSGHNTQPWRFTVSDMGIRIRPDLSRRTSVVDPDDIYSALMAQGNLVTVSKQFPFETIVVAMDFSENSSATLRYAGTRWLPAGQP
jgi:hypothetical protein